MQQQQNEQHSSLDQMTQDDGGLHPPVHSKIRTKRPRFITTSTPTDAPIAKAKCLKPPSENPTIVVKPEEPNATEKCAFCCLQGSIRECEGVLLGPFKLLNRDPRRGPVAIYAHRNCVMWSPEGYENDQGRLQQVDHLYQRARRKKCFVCTGKGATLGCMYMGARCCRPMHFRCALLTGATLRDWYQTFCHRHAGYAATKDEPMHYLEHTPVREVLIRQGNGCVYCAGDSYDRSRGTILTCNKCLRRAHSRCINPKLRNDVQFATNSFEDRHYCKTCMPCKICDRPVDQRVYEERRHRISVTDPLDLNLANDIGEDCDTLLCVGCNHFAVHVNCLPPGASRSRWRCDLCHICRHCEAVGVSPETWNEEHEACALCHKKISDGNVVCPVCQKLYHDFEDIPMVQCDSCDRWIHAISCGGFTVKSFKKLETQPSETYHCPLCTEEKKKREPVKRRKLSKGDQALVAKGAHSEALEAILKKGIPADGEIAFYSVRSALREDGLVPDKVINNLSIGTDFCRHCCSGGAKDALRFCVTCGECSHSFCEDAVARHKGCNGVSQDELGWQCSRCRMVSHASDKSVAMKAANGSIKASRSSGDLDGAGEGEQGVYWDDERECEFCHKGERAGGIEGRLLVWGSSMNSDLCDVWVHVGCALWSAGVVFDGSLGDYDILVGPRRTVLGLAKRNVCSCCGKNGATVKCSVGGCGNIYHLSCAEEEKVGCVVGGSGGRGDLSNVVWNGRLHAMNDESVRIVCATHEAWAKKFAGRNSRRSLADLSGKLNEERMIRIVDSQGYSVKAETAEQRVVSMDRVLSLRVGCLAVLKFGDVVPEVNEFIVNGCLVPLGYCAARRYWSMRYSGRRCTYILEVSGHAQTGPNFVITCDEASNMRIENKDIDVAWQEVWRHAMETQGLLGGVDNGMIQGGLEVFGLDGCETVVRHIESLPLASMFVGRYESKTAFAAKAKGNNIVFYDSLAKNYVPPKVKVNVTGSARSEGYVRPKDVSESKVVVMKDTPSVGFSTYENIRGGCAFQLRVIRETLCGIRDGGGGDWTGDVGKQHAFGIGEMANTNHAAAGQRRSRRGSGPLPIESVRSAEGLEENRSKSKIRSKKVSHKDNMAVRPKPQMNLTPMVKQVTKILRSEINGWGVFALTDVAKGELVIEYIGEIIRPKLSDLRELKYCRQGIGCYMFEVVAGVIVDATVCGNAARFINHSCAPNCFSKTISVEGRELVAIFSKRRIQRGEELSYDYRFPSEDGERVECRCGAAQCTGFMN